MPALSTKEREELLSDRGGGPGGFIDDWGDGGGGEGKPEPERTPPPDGYMIGIWLTIVSVAALFLTLTTLYVYLRAGRHPIVTPPILWVSTGFILASSVTFEVARRALKRRQEKSFQVWIVTTLVLGLCFLISQSMVWRELIAGGFYMTGNFRSSLAYTFTGLHALHLLGGLFGLSVVTFRPSSKWTALRRRVSVDATAIYWHFLDVLWVYLLLLIFIWN
ncbi:MAG: heme-copper oxidase subunit III [Blastocatellales bacterium]